MVRPVSTPALPARKPNRPEPTAPRSPRMDVPDPALRDLRDGRAQARSQAGQTLRDPDSLLREAFGRANLPPPLELQAALEAAAAFAPMADRAVPGLGRLVEAVIADERHKLARLIDLARQ